jgi:TonB-dependent Receptor Plug Domain
MIERATSRGSSGGFSSHPRALLLAAIIAASAPLPASAPAQSAEQQQPRTDQPPADVIIPPVTVQAKPPTPRRAPPRAAAPAQPSRTVTAPIQNTTPAAAASAPAPAGPPAQAAGELTVPGAVVNATPTLRVGEVLEVTPGLIVSQHSGEGKANQYFLRGFALDHGTDFAVNVDGMPINMPTHGHGQGYTTSIS